MPSPAPARDGKYGMVRFNGNAVAASGQRARRSAFPCLLDVRVQHLTRGLSALWERSLPDADLSSRPAIARPRCGRPCCHALFGSQPDAPCCSILEMIGRNSGDGPQRICLDDAMARSRYACFITIATGPTIVRFCHRATTFGPSAGASRVLPK
jgi:hypothetical protein